MTNEASRPDLDFMAPEYALRGNDADILQVNSKISSKMERYNEAVLIHNWLKYNSYFQLTPSSDMFSIGMVAFALYNTKPLFTNSGSWINYKKNASEVRNKLN